MTSIISQILFFSSSFFSRWFVPPFGTFWVDALVKHTWVWCWTAVDWMKSLNINTSPRTKLTVVYFKTVSKLFMSLWKHFSSTSIVHWPKGVFLRECYGVILFRTGLYLWKHSETLTDRWCVISASCVWLTSI